MGPEESKYCVARLFDLIDKMMNNMELFAQTFIVAIIDNLVRNR
jgi:hypothetical protein